MLTENRESSCLLCIAIFITVSLLPHTIAQQTNTCLSTFLNIFGQCMDNTSPAITLQNFLWVTRDGNMGTKPTDLPTFTQNVCNQKDSLFQCGRTQVSRIKGAQATLCSDNDKTVIEQFGTAIFVSLNNTCAHPCRSKLVASLRTCFETAEVNPDLFLPNITTPRHSLIGDTEANITAFCNKRDEVIECMRTNVASCPDSPIVLPATGLDVDTLNETVTLLCDNREIYLNGMTCASNRSAAEEACQRALVSEVVEVERQFRNINISLSTYTTDMCRIRLNNIRCDLNAMDRREKEAQCDYVTLGLRREQECKLVPVTCQTMFSDRLLDMCNPRLFETDNRQAFVMKLKGSGARNLRSSLLGILTAAMMAMLFVMREAF